MAKKTTHITLKLTITEAKAYFDAAGNSIDSCEFDEIVGVTGSRAKAFAACRAHDKMRKLIPWDEIMKEEQ